MDESILEFQRREHLHEHVRYDTVTDEPDWNEIREMSRWEASRENRDLKAAKDRYRWIQTSAFDPDEDPRNIDSEAQNAVQ